MFDKKLIAALAMLIFIMDPAMAMGQQVDTSDPYNGFSNNSNIGAEKRVSIVLAQNDKAAVDEGEKSESEPQTSESEAADDDKKKSSDTESKPLDPFVPSERIAGEQAVDFPADI